MLETTHKILNFSLGPGPHGGPPGRPCLLAGSPGAGAQGLGQNFSFFFCFFSKERDLGALGGSQGTRLPAGQPPGPAMGSGPGRWPKDVLAGRATPSMQASKKASKQARFSSEG